MKYNVTIHGVIASCFFLPSSYATQLGHVTIADPVLGSRTVIYEQINEFAVVEGDILIGKVSHLNNQGAIITPKAGGTRWPNGIIPYEIDEELPFRNKLAIYQAIDHWQRNTHLEFLELTSKNRYNHKDYISFIHAEGTTCSSYVGKKGGKQEINLAPRCTTMNTVHEIGHALGLWHEQSRSDRSSYVRILWENIEDEHKHNFAQQLTDGKDFGEYDYQSIMHYGTYAFSKNGEKTIIPLTDGVEIGQRSRLSEKDIAAIKSMYPEV
ncbi:Dot/Icm T4SS effector Zinc-dependent metalloprotease LegP [Legionella worsleiensis]|uniref:Metalloproteinase-like protein n=1 Tax=Legionella worsleiensis TaxID=45076 RepID=A0A0W1AEC9_9GAMM|nr:Dot/Icm T4SS effector Zinc-dependent metalloprotease LegP [Legionella worsleiensis]KTD79686.1 metalloproteinase-like protein [Legionella worsleiensis]STY32197.1 astacin protease [Legionella worsleiensis]